MQSFINLNLNIKIKWFIKDLIKNWTLELYHDLQNMILQQFHRMFYSFLTPLRDRTFVTCGMVLNKKKGNIMKIIH